MKRDNMKKPFCLKHPEHDHVLRIEWQVISHSGYSQYFQIQYMLLLL